MDDIEFEKIINKKQQDLIITVNDKLSNNTLKFSIVNKKTLWRAKSLYQKEPITIKWIRKFKKDEVFFDVGANVGMYTIFAAIISKQKKKQVKLKMFS